MLRKRIFPAQPAWLGIDPLSSPSPIPPPALKNGLWSTWDSWRQTQRIRERTSVSTRRGSGCDCYGILQCLRRVQAAGCSVLRRVLNLDETARMNVHVSHMLYCICALYKHKL